MSFLHHHRFLKLKESKAALQKILMINVSLSKYPCSQYNKFKKKYLLQVSVALTYFHSDRSRNKKMISTKMKSLRHSLRLYATMLSKESKLCKKIPKKNLINEFIKFNNKLGKLISLLNYKTKA